MKKSVKKKSTKKISRSRKIKTSNKYLFALLIAVFVIAGFISISFSVSNNVIDIKSNGLANILGDPEDIDSGNEDVEQQRKCITHDECKSGEYCDARPKGAEGVCTPGECIDEGDCEHLQLCGANVCYDIQCKDDTDCEDTLKCNYYYECFTPECLVDSDCTEFENGACIEDQCSYGA